MSRIAIFADVHGNMPALEAVLTDIAAQRVDEILVAGDLVGRGPEGSRVVRRVCELGLPVIGGNHEDYLLGFRRGEVPAEWIEADEWAASRWMAAELSEDDAAYLAALPFSLARPGLRLVHGTPRSNREGIGPWTSDERLEAHLDEVSEPVLVCAHTHRPLLRALVAGTVVNVGSVGLPFNGDRRAQYAIFTAHGAGWRVEFRQVEYDLDRIFAIYESSGFLAHGGITARLLHLELEHARPLLVPFLQWARARGVPPVDDDLDDFLRIHPPDEPLVRRG
jgi:predicted phosphodiesterase